MDSTLAAVLALFSAGTGLTTVLVSVYRSRHEVHKSDVEALALALDNLRDDYERVDRLVTRLRLDVAAWERRFNRVCRQTGLNPGRFITQPLGEFKEDDGSGTD